MTTTRHIRVIAELDGPYPVVTAVDAESGEILVDAQEARSVRDCVRIVDGMLSIASERVLALVTSDEDLQDWL